MFNYMTPLTFVTEHDDTSIEVTGARDIEDLLYRVMDEFFFGFAANLFVCHSVRITEIGSDDGRVDTFHARAVGRGETFDRSKHEQGTEIKAITMHNMHINQTPSRTDVFVTVDI